MLERWGILGGGLNKVVFFVEVSPGFYFFMFWILDHRVGVLEVAYVERVFE